MKRNNMHRPEFKAWDGERWWTEGVFLSYDGKLWVRPIGRRVMMSVNWKVSLYTHEHDANDIPIYDGDIAINGWDDEKYIVSRGWAGNEENSSAKCYVICPENHDGDIEQLTPNISGALSVIGNIHQNPELLEV